MNASNAKDYLPLITAFAEGKTIQYFQGGCWGDCSDLCFNSQLSRYRVKPEPATYHIVRLKSSKRACATFFERATAESYLVGCSSIDSDYEIVTCTENL